MKSEVSKALTTLRACSTYTTNCPLIRIASMTSTNLSPSHFVLFPVLHWGHLRPFCIFATRLVREQENIAVTVIVAPQVLDKARNEVSRQFLTKPSESSKALQRIRILSPSIDDLNGLDSSYPMNLYGDAYPATYQALYQAEPITCSVTGVTFNALPAPCAAIVDYFDLPQIHAIRAISGHSVPIIICITAGAGAIIRVYGAESIGGAGDISARIDAEAARTGQSIDEIGNQIYMRTEGKLVQIPGLPAMYDYEFFPQTFPIDKPIHKVRRRAYTSFRECDAIIATTSSIYESGSLDALKQSFFDMQKKVHVLGPLLPPGYGTETQNTDEGVSNDIEVFLNEMLVQHGKRSVFFVSFGTVFWPPVPEYIDELIEALIEKKVPFIFAYASLPVQLSEQQIGKIKSSGLGISATWCPQQFILNHPATGWFITHGGFNSVTESLGSGIPLICWPIFGDQPVAATHLTENLNVAFELFQVRTGDGLKPLHRNGLTPEGTREAVGIELRQTIDLCRSEKGQELRINAEDFKVKFAKAWEEDGIARREIRDFLDHYT